MDTSPTVEVIPGRQYKLTIMATPERDALLSALRVVVDPELKKDFVSLGFVKDLQIDVGRVSCTVELTTPACPGKDQMRDQALAAMINPIEMHADAPAVAARLAQFDHIRADFAAAFGTPEITPERITLALEQFLLTQISADSKFDRSRRGAATLTADEQRGLELFLTEYDPARGKFGADCFHCHGGPLFSDFAYKNNGLLVRGSDFGREKVTASADDAGKFKTPSLRNVAVTGPYMHDGRFRTLEEVVAHYDHGVVRSPTLDPNIAKHPDEGLKLSRDDQRALVAFLRTLTDPRFSVRLRPPPRPPPPLAVDGE